MRVFDSESPFARGVNKLLTVLFLGILWAVASLPVVTVGSSTAALFEGMLKVQKNEEGYVGRQFFHAFRENWKPGLFSWLPMLFAGILILGNLFYYAVLGGGRFPVQTVVFAALAILYLMVLTYLFPVIARFENTVPGHFRVALALAVRNPGWSALLLIFELAAAFAAYFFLYFPLLFLMGIPAYLQSVVFNRIFDTYIDAGKITGSASSKGRGGRL